MKVIICDETLRENGINKSLEMSFKEKLELAKQLDLLNVDIIGVGPVADEKTDSILFRTICSFATNSTISCSAVATKKSVDLAYAAIRNAENKILSIEFPSTVMQMEYMYHKKPEAMIETIKELVSYAKSLNVKVEAVMVDATRAEKAYIVNAVKAAMEVDADYIAIMDTASVMIPAEFKNFVQDIKNETKATNLGIGCSDELSFATATVFETVNEVSYVKTSVFGGSLPKFGDVCQVIKSLGFKKDLEMNVNYTKFKDVVGSFNKGIESFVQTRNQELNDDLNDLDSNMTIEELNETLAKLGYVLSVADQNSVYEMFKMVAEKKGAIKLKELDVIVANVAMQVPQTFELDSYVINSGNKIKSTASIALVKNGETLYGLSHGDGPIDAAFKAIESILGSNYELDDFQIKSTTAGAESMGEALVKLRYNGQLYSGRGISTDINGASIRAYIQAVNKIAYEGDK